MIRFQGSFTRETLLRATRLTMNRFRFFLWFFGAMTVLSLFGTLIVPLLNGAPFDPVFLATPLVFAVLLGLLVWSPYAAVDRSLKTNKLIQEPLEGHADETGVYFSTAHSRSDLPWDVFHKAVMSDTMVLLGQSAQQFYPFPREFFASDEDWTSFQTLVREKAPQSKDGGLLKMFVIWTVIFIVVILLWTAFQANR